MVISPAPSSSPSQFAALEDPSADALTVDATLPTARVVAIIRDAFGV